MHQWTQTSDVRHQHCGRRAIVSSHATRLNTFHHSTIYLIFQHLHGQRIKLMLRYMGYYVKRRLGSNDRLCCITRVNDTALTDGWIDAKLGWYF